MQSAGHFLLDKSRSMWYNGKSGAGEVKRAPAPRRFKQGAAFIPRPPKERRTIEFLLIECAQRDLNPRRLD